MQKHTKNALVIGGGAVGVAAVGGVGYWIYRRRQVGSATSGVSTGSPGPSGRTAASALESQAATAAVSASANPYLGSSPGSQAGTEAASTSQTLASQAAQADTQSAAFNQYASSNSAQTQTFIRAQSAGVNETGQAPSGTSASTIDSQDKILVGTYNPAVFNGGLVQSTGISLTSIPAGQTVLAAVGGRAYWLTGNSDGTVTVYQVPIAVAPGV